jgi:hypothetical protein
MTRAPALATVLACCLAAALPAGAATQPKDLWATVNICDTETHPDMMGVRGSMPGDAQHTKMYMRFVAQYYSPAKQLWLEAGKDAVSKWIYVGSGQFARRQAGYTFAFGHDPAAGSAKFTLRGAVDFKWTKRGRIVRTAHVNTKGGHPATKSADPKDYTAGTCDMTLG